MLNLTFFGGQKSLNGTNRRIFRKKNRIIKLSNKTQNKIFKVTFL